VGYDGHGPIYPSQSFGCEGFVVFSPTKSKATACGRVDRVILPFGVIKGCGYARDEPITVVAMIQIKSMASSSLDMEKPIIVGSSNKSLKKCREFTHPEIAVFIILLIIL